MEERSRFVGLCMGAEDALIGRLQCRNVKWARRFAWRPRRIGTDCLMSSNDKKIRLQDRFIFSSGVCFFFKFYSIKKNMQILTRNTSLLFLFFLSFSLLKYQSMENQIQSLCCKRRIAPFRPTHVFSGLTR